MYCEPYTRDEMIINKVTLLCAYSGVARDFAIRGGLLSLLPLSAATHKNVAQPQRRKKKCFRHQRREKNMPPPPPFTPLCAHITMYDKVRGLFCNHETCWMHGASVLFL